MNILYLTTHLNIGGITSYVLSLAKGMKLKGHNIYIASSGGRLEDRFIREGINYIHTPIRTKSEISYKIFLSFIKLLPLLREKEINILHANSRVSSVLAALLSKCCQIPYVSTCHGFFKPRLFRRLFPLWGKLVIAICDSVKEHLIADFCTPEEKIRLIYHGIDLRKIRPGEQISKAESRRQLGLREGAVVGIVARLSDVKGHRFLIAAMQKVIRDIPDAQLLIVGEGKEKDALLKQTQQLDIEKKVFFIPSVEDTAKVLSAIDLFVMPSLQEGLSLSIMEAMAQGLTIIASDVGGINSLIKDGFNGRLVKPQDTQGLYKAISELLKDRQQAVIYGRNALQTIEDNFSSERMVLQTERVYLECLNEKHY